MMHEPNGTKEPNPEDARNDKGKDQHFELIRSSG